jgi:hypothetical protein
MDMGERQRKDTSLSLWTTSKECVVVVVEIRVLIRHVIHFGSRSSKQ